jgi:hypothetical protein
VKQITPKARRDEEARISESVNIRRD